MDNAASPSVISSSGMVWYAICGYVDHFQILQIENISARRRHTAAHLRRVRIWAIKVTSSSSSSICCCHDFVVLARSGRDALAAGGRHVRGVLCLRGDRRTRLLVPGVHRPYQRQETATPADLIVRATTDCRQHPNRTDVTCCSAARQLVSTRSELLSISNIHTVREHFFTLRNDASPTSGNPYEILLNLSNYRWPAAIGLVPLWQPAKYD